MMKVMMYGLPALSLVATSWLPAATQLTFFCGGMLSFGQAWLMRKSWFRQFWNMTPLPTPKRDGDAAAAPTPYKGTMKRAAHPVFSTAELSSRFQGPAPGPDRVIQGRLHEEPVAEEEVRKSKISQVVDGAVKDVKETVSSITASGREIMGQSTKKVEEKMAKRELDDRKRFEKQRQEEVRREKWELENDRRAERAQRKLESMERMAQQARRKS